MLFKDPVKKVSLPIKIDGASMSLNKRLKFDHNLIVKKIENLVSLHIWLQKRNTVMELECHIGNKLWNFENITKKNYVELKMAFVGW